MAIDERAYMDTPETDPRFSKSNANRQQIEQIRSGSVFKTLRDRFQQECAREKRPCYLCGDAIDYRLPYPHPFSFSLDHIKPVKDYPQLMLDSNNFAASHSDCNKRKGTDEPALMLGVPSEIWGFVLVAGFFLVMFIGAWHPTGQVLGQG